MLLLKKSEATAARRRIPFRMVDGSGAAVTGLTFAAADIKVSKNGAAEENSAGADTEIAGGLYYYEATQGELDTIGFVTFRATGAGAGVAVAVVQVVEFDPYDAAGLGLSSVAAIKAKTDNLPPDPADMSDLLALIDALPTGDENADSLLDRANGVETGWTVRQVLRLVASILVGKLSGGGSPQNTFRDLNDTKDRVVATVDSSGNRSAVAKDAS